MENMPEQTAAQEEEISLENQNEQALYELLDKIREAATTQRGAGTRFETLVRDYLNREPSYKDLYSKVQTFKDWAAEHTDIAPNKKDIGIDLVATNADCNGYTAVQCKFYLPGATVSKADIDSFIAASNTPYFTSRLIVATNSKWGENVKTELHSLTPPVMLITREDLAKSRIDWSAYIKGDTADIPRRKPRPYQQDAINAVAEGFKTNDRGKLIMACGTGKTFTALKIAEHPEIAGAGSLVLFLVPSLHLLSQTLTDWKQQSTYKINAFAVCSDSATGKADDEDIDAITSADELQYPATTNPLSLAHKVKAALGNPGELTVIFSTYQSIEVISDAQKKYSLPDFDLVICDEAHRTAGGNMVNEDETVFTLVHSNENVRAAKRLYMTATPKIYGAAAKGQKERGEVELYSMDDEAVFGPTFFTLSFAEAVNLGCLTDYKVVVLTVDEKLVGDEFNIFDTPIGGLNVSDAAKIIGTWRALSKYGLKDPNGKAYAEADAEPAQTPASSAAEEAPAAEKTEATPVEAEPERQPEPETAAVPEPEPEPETAPVAPVAEKTAAKAPKAAPAAPAQPKEEKAAASTQYSGKWLIFETEAGMYAFELRASNGEKMLGSGEYTTLAGAKSESQKFMLGSGLCMSIGMVASMVLIYGIAEEKEKHTLRTLMLANVGAGQILTAKLAVTLALTAITEAVCFLIIGAPARMLPAFLAIGIIGAIPIMLVSALLGLLSRDQMTSGLYAVPMLLVAIAPMFSMIGEEVSNVTRFLPTGGTDQLFKLLAEDRLLSMDALPPVAVTAVWIIVCTVAFGLLFRRLARDN